MEINPNYLLTAEELINDIMKDVGGVPPETYSKLIHLQGYLQGGALFSKMITDPETRTAFADATKG